jgi:hypothetical protein
LFSTWPPYFNKSPLSESQERLIKTLAEPLALALVDLHVHPLEAAGNRSEDM